MNKLDRYATRAGWIVFVLAVLYEAAHVVAAVTHTPIGTVLATAAGLTVAAVLVAAALLKGGH